ncbi:odorant receptor 10-like [Periplaneta americana]
MLFQISVYVVFLCLNVFAMSMVAVGSIEFINTMLFVVTVISLLLMPAWYGNEIRVQSAELAKAASICDWIDAPHSFKTSLRLIIQRAQKPVQLTALKFCAVDLNMFTMVLKATYSYYQVLHKIFNE